MAIDPLPENPTTEQMRAFARRVAKAEDGDRETLLFERYFPLGLKVWPGLKIRDKAAIKAAGGQKKYCKSVLNGLSSETCPLAEKAAALEPGAREILDWWKNPHRNQFTDWEPTETWSLKWFLQIAAKHEIKDESPPVKPEQKPAGTGEQPAVEPGFMGPRSPLFENLTPEEAVQITSRAAGTEAMELQVQIMAEQSGNDMMIARNIVSELQRRIMQLEDELMANGLPVPDSAMTDEMTDWLATMEDDPKPRRGSSRKRDATANQITTVEDLDAALTQALTEITAMVGPKAKDVHRILQPMWTRTPANLRNDFMGLADLSFMSSGTKPAGDVLFWCETDSPFETMEAVERTQSNELRVAFSSPPKPPDRPDQQPPDEQPDTPDQQPADDDGVGDLVDGDREMMSAKLTEDIATIRAALGDLKVRCRGQQDSFWFYYEDNETFYGLVEKIRDEAKYRYGIGQALSEPNYMLEEAVKKLIADRSKAASPPDEHPLGPLVINTSRPNLGTRIRAAWNGVDFNLNKLARLVPKKAASEQDWETFIAEVDKVFIHDDPCPIVLQDDERAISWTTRNVILRRDGKAIRVKITAQNEKASE